MKCPRDIPWRKRLYYRLDDWSFRFDEWLATPGPVGGFLWLFIAVVLPAVGMLVFLVLCVLALLEWLGLIGGPA